MMMTYRKAHTVIKSTVIAAAAIFFMASCQDNEMTQVTEDATTHAAAVGGPNAESLTITGANTFFSESVECSTCTYVVAANATTIDGKELGLKPGSVICLDAAVQYGNLEFVNVDGTEESPITIGTCN